MAKYDGLLGQPLLEVEEPDKEGGVTLIFKDNRFLFVKIEDGKLSTISIPEWWYGNVWCNKNGWSYRSARSR